MTEPINLTQLREQTAKHPVSWPHDTMLALIDIAEAAHHLASVQFTNHLTAPEHWTPLNKALARTTTNP